MAAQASFLTLFLLAALAVLAGTPGVRAQQACTTQNGFPGGSYQQTCQSCQLDDANPNRFGASCNDRSGHPKQSWIEDVTFCAVDSTENLDGTLFCRPDSAKLPAGSYQQTCANCRTENDELKCRCSSGGSYQPETTLGATYRCAPGGDIWNEGGTLMCGPDPDETVLPAGSYKQSCANCGFADDTLSCRCKSGGSYQAQIYLHHVSTASGSTQPCQAGTIWNDHGALKCDRVPAGSTNEGGGAGGTGGTASSLACDSPGYPEGSYRQSCRCTDYSDPVLTADCSDNGTYDGSYEHFDTTFCAPGSTWNDHGRLRCSPSADLPAGSYKQSCTNCRMEGDQLRCECRADNAYRPATTLDMGSFSCKQDEIWNEKGTLMCRPQDDLAGGGSYGQTCGNCTIENGGLGCWCNRQGTYVETPRRLYFWACRSGTVTNSNGQLTCSWNGDIADRCSNIVVSQDSVTVSSCDGKVVPRFQVNATTCPDRSAGLYYCAAAGQLQCGPCTGPGGGSRESTDPTLEAVEPARGDQGATLEVVFSGSNLDQPLSAGAPGVTVSKLRATDPSRLTATLRISAKAHPGPTTIRLKTRTGTATIAFTIVERRVPRVTTVSPAKGLQGTATQVTFHGSNLDTVTAIAGTGGITASGLQASGPGTLKATLAIPHDAKAGRRTLRLTGPGGQATVTFSIVALPPPAVASLTPGQGGQGETVQITIKGTHLDNASGVIAPAGLTVVDFHAIDATTLTVTIRIAPGTAPGSKTLKIRAPSGTDNAIFKVIHKAGGGSYQ